MLPLENITFASGQQRLRVARDVCVCVANVYGLGVPFTQSALRLRS